MHKKIIKTSLCLAVITVVIALISVLFMQNRFPKQSVGETLFADTYDYGTRVNKIKLSSNMGVITLLQKEGYWVIEEADEYFSRIDLINNLLLALNNSTFYNKIDFSEKTIKEAKLGEDGILITTFANDNRIDEVVIGKSAQNPEYTFVHPKDSKEIWLADGQFLLPREYYSWIMQPIIEMPVDIVEEITDGERIVNRGKIGEELKNENGKVILYQDILNNASRIFVEDVRKDKNFDISNYPNQRVLRFTMFPGLVIEYLLFYNDSEYWLKINLDKTALPKKIVNDYIRDNKIFYDGWYFKLPERVGKVLVSTPLK